MTLALSNYLEGKLYDHLMRGVAFTPPSAWYVQLHTGDPGEAGTSNVLATSGAARVSTTFGAAASRQVAGAGALDFGPYLADPPAVTHVSVWDASSNGNCLAQGAAGSSVDVSTDGMIRIAAAALTIALTAFSSSPVNDISTAASNALLDLAFRGTAYSTPSGHKLHGYTSNPGVADSGTELSGNGYSAQSVSFGAATDGVGSNSGAVTFGPATGSNWAACTHLAVKDGSGNLLIFGAITGGGFTLLIGQSWQWAIGELVATFA